MYDTFAIFNTLACQTYSCRVIYHMFWDWVNVFLTVLSSSEGYFSLKKSDQCYSSSFSTAKETSETNMNIYNSIPYVHTLGAKTPLPEINFFSPTESPISFTLPLLIWYVDSMLERSKSNYEFWKMKSYKVVALLDRCNLGRDSFITLNYSYALPFFILQHLEEQ